MKQSLIEKLLSFVAPIRRPQAFVPSELKDSLGYQYRMGRRVGVEPTNAIVGARLGAVVEGEWVTVPQSIVRPYGSLLRVAVYPIGESPEPTQEEIEWAELEKCVR